MSTASFDSSLGAFDAAILARVINPQQAQLSVDTAHEFLSWDFPPEDQRRMAELAERAREGTLTESERDEIDGYLRVGNIVSLMQAKAKLSLKRQGRA